MNNMEFNKIFAALLVAGIVASLSGFVAEKLTEPEKLKENAYKIEGVASASGGAAVEAKPEPILEMIATADVAKGQQVAKVCASCHNFEKGGANGMGPNLYGVVGRAKGAHEGFAYSDGMKAKGGTWTYADLNHFLWKPKSFVSDTKMTFIGVKKPEDRAAVIAWLRTLSDSPMAEPSESEIAAEKAELAPAEEQTAPTAGEQGQPDTGASGQKGADTEEKPDQDDATAAVPEGNGGTGHPVASDVKEGKEPKEGLSETPSEKLDDKVNKAGDQDKKPKGDEEPQE